MPRPLVCGLVVAAALFTAAPPRWPAAPNSEATLQAAEPMAQVLRRLTLGGYAEDVTYITSGRMKGRLAFATRSEVVSVQDSAEQPVTPQRVFGFEAVAAEVGHYLRPTGLVYVDEWDAYVLNSSVEPATGPWHLFVFDPLGRYVTWPIVWAPGQQERGFPEGLAYVPSGASDWPEAFRGRVLMVVQPASGSGLPWRIDVLEPVESDREFHVRTQVTLPWPPPGQGVYSYGYWADVEPLPGGDLLLTAFHHCSVYRWHVADLPPGVTADLIPEPVVGCDSTRPPFVEGVARRPDGHLSLLTVNGGPRISELETVPAGGGWSVARAHDVRFGLGIPFPSDITWDSGNDRLLVTYATDARNLERPNAIAAIPLSFNTWAAVAVGSQPADYLDQNLLGLAYREPASEAVIGRRGRFVEDFPFPSEWPPEWAWSRTPALMRVSFANPDAPVATIVDLSDTLKAMVEFFPWVYQPTSWGNGVRAIAYRPADDTLAVRMVGEPLNVFILGPDGAWLDTIPVDSAICPGSYLRPGNLAYDPVRGRYLVSGACMTVSPDDVERPLLVLLDATGHALRVIDQYSELGTWTNGSLAAIGSGPFAGAFALLDLDDQLIVFTVR